MMSVHEPGEPKTLRRPEPFEANSTWNRNPRENMIGRTICPRSTTGRLRSLVLEALTTLSITHDCLEEREEALRVLPGFHGADLVLEEVDAMLGNGASGENVT